MADQYLDVDEIMANHIAHLFIRDPLVIFSETLDQDDSVSGDHFEVSQRIYAMNVLIDGNRIYNQQIGRQCVSSRLLQAHP